MQLRLFATRTIPVAALAVQPTTFGKSHTLKMTQGAVTISLPSARHVHASSESLTDDPGNPDHTWIGVEEVTLTASLNDQFRFDGVDSDFNSPAIFESPDLRRSFIITESLLDDGFDLWKRTLRWTSLASNIGIDEIETAQSKTQGHGFKLFREADGALVRGYGGKSTSHGLGKVSREAWDSAAKALAANEPPPVWFDFLHEAIRQITVGNNRAAVVNAAIAAETVLRACFMSKLPPICDALAEQSLDRIPAQKILGNWEAISGVDKAEAKKQGRSEVHKLFDLRNIVMHEGLQDRGKLSEIEKIISKASKFILAADDYLGLKLNAPQRIFPAPRVLERITGAKGRI